MHCLCIAAGCRHDSLLLQGSRSLQPFRPCAHVHSQVLILILLCKRYSYCATIPVQTTCPAECTRYPSPHSHSRLLRQPRSDPRSLASGDPRMPETASTVHVQRRLSTTSPQDFGSQIEFPKRAKTDCALPLRLPTPDMTTFLAPSRVVLVDFPVCQSGFVYDLEVECPSSAGKGAACAVICRLHQSLSSKRL